MIFLTGLLIAACVGCFIIGTWSYSVSKYIKTEVETDVETEVEKKIK